MITSILDNKQDLGYLPPELKEFAEDPKTIEKINKIIADFEIGKDKEPQIKLAVLSVIKGETDIYDLPSLIEEKLQVDFETALDIDGRLYEELFSDIEDILAAQYAAHQASNPQKPVLAKAPVVKDEDIEKAKKQKTENIVLIEKAIKKFNLFSAPTSSVIPSDRKGSRDSSVAPLSQNDKENEDLRKKFSEIADSFLCGARTKTQFKNTLTKDVSSGGLGMAHELADEAAEFLASYLRIGEIEKKKEKSPLASLRLSRSGPTPLLQRGEEKKLPPSASPVELHRVAPKFHAEGERSGEKGDRGGFINPRPSLSEGGSSRPVPPNVKIEVSFESEEKEAKKIEPKIAKMRVAAPKLLSLSFEALPCPVVALSEALAKNDVTEGVQKALAELNYTFPSSELQERLKAIIDARVRNVRTSMQTFEKLTQDIPSGGLGFGKQEADKVSLVLNKYLEEKNKDIYGSKLAEIKQLEDEEKKKNEEKTRASEEAERKNFDERYKKLTGKEATLPALTKKAEPRSELRSTTGEIAEKKFAPGASPPSASPAELHRVAPKFHAEGERSGEKGDGGGFINPPHPAFSKGGSSSPRPVLEDIKFTPKLAGPLEEIARLALDDFRKLSGDPKEAILKIKDKLSLLREESYKKYQAGIEAWQKSPLYSEYLSIINKSLKEGQNLEQSLNFAKTLTPDEFDAIINSKIGE